MELFFGVCFLLYFLKSFQSPSLSASAGQHLADLTVKTLQSIRNEESFDAFYDVVLIKVKKYPVIAAPALPRKCAPAGYEFGIAVPTYPQTAHDHYRMIYFKAIDDLIFSMKDHVDQPAFKVYASSENLLKAVKGEDISKECKDLASKFTTDVDVNSLSAHEMITSQLTYTAIVN